MFKTSRALVPLVVFLALVAMAALFALADEWNAFGYLMVLGIPIAGSFAIGWYVEAQPQLVVVLAVVAVGSLVVLAMTGGLAGVICGGVLLAVLVLPAVVGSLLGRWMQRRLERRTGSRPAIVPVLLFAAVGGGMWIEARLTPAFPAETVSTRRVLDLGRQEAWERILFYEEVPFEPPLLARIGVPHPLRTEGRVGGVGDVKRCVYTTGHLTKRITRFVPGEELVFAVVEQRGVEDESAELLTGSFRFAALADGRTAVTLTTTYRPLLQARWVWRPFERAVAHVLHGHVLDGMERPAAPVERPRIAEATRR